MDYYYSALYRSVVSRITFTRAFATMFANSFSYKCSYLHRLSSVYVTEQLNMMKLVHKLVHGCDGFF